MQKEEVKTSGITDKFGHRVEKGSRAKANRVLPGKRSSHSIHPLPSIQETFLHMEITRWSIAKSDWLYSLQSKMENLYKVIKNKIRSWPWLKKVGKTIKPFRYDLNQICYLYSVEVINRFKGLDLIECLKNYGQRFVTLDKRWWSRPFPRKRNAKSKMVVWGGLTNSWEKKRSKRQRWKGKIDPSECRVPKTSKVG